MLRRIFKARPSIRLFCRNQSTSPYDGTFKKLRAYPFQLSPEQAQREMAKIGSIVNDGNKFIGSLLAPYISFVDYQRPVRITPVYFPGWLISAYVKAEVSYDNTKPTASVMFRNTFVPGADVPLLSTSPLWPRDLENEEPVPYTEDLLTQYDHEVQCIPFNISPFSILDIVTSSEQHSWRISDNLKVSPNSIDPKLFSASPVLMPLYIAQYETREHEDGAGRELVTMFIQAHSSSSSTTMAEWSDEFERIPQQVFQRVVHISPCGVVIFGDAASRIGIQGISLRPISDARDALSLFLDRYLDSYNAIKNLSSMGYLPTDDDLRIRELTVEEQTSLNKYFENIAEISMVRRIIKSMEDVEHNKGIVLTIGRGQLPHLAGAQEAASTLKNKLKDLEEQQTKLVPEWWTAWKESQNQETSEK